LLVDPRPPGAGFFTTFTTTADDRARGGSPITAAELFLQTPQPNANDSGQGFPMSAGDGAFDASVENVSWQGRLAVPVGSTCAWGHARDGSGNWGPFMATCFLAISTTHQPPTVSIRSPTEGQAFPASSRIQFVWTMSDDSFVAGALLVWANVTADNQTTPLLTGAAGMTSVGWTAPDFAVDHVTFHVDILDPSGLRGSADRTFSVTPSTPAPPAPPPPSPLVIVVTVLIVLVPLAFLLSGFLLARKKQRPPIAPAPPPLSPAGAGVAASVTATKVCPRCRATVNAIDVTCFFCGYRFDEGTGRPP
jgi:hypothetical protein